MKLKELAFGVAGGVVSALCMLLLGILGNLGYYTEAAEIMAKFHVYFDLSLLGVIAGMIEGFVATFVGLYIFAWLYNHCPWC